MKKTEWIDGYGNIVRYLRAFSFNEIKKKAVQTQRYFLFWRSQTTYTTHTFDYRVSGFQSHYVWICLSVDYKHAVDKLQVN